jgi:hypothetical protein
MYEFLGQSTVTIQPSGGFRSFFRPMTRFFPRFFTQPVVVPPPCVPVQIPAGAALGRDTNGNLTVNGQTFCNNSVNYGARYAPVPYGPIYFP